MQLPAWIRRTGNLFFAAAVILIVCLAHHYRKNAIESTEQESAPNILRTDSRYSHITGFGGPIPVRIMLSPDLKTINKIEFESNAEDPEFWQRVLDSGIFKKYLNRTPAEALRLPIDAVTGATFSSRAAQETIRARLAETVSAPLAVETPSLIQFQWLDGLGLLLLAVNLYYFFHSMSGKTRIILLVCNITTFGLLIHCCLSLSQFSGWLKTAPYWKLSLPSLIFLLTVWLAVWKGRNFYCGILCPYGGAQELASRLGRKLGARTYPAGFRAGPYLRRIILGVTVTTVICGVSFPVIEPFPAFLLDTSWWILILAIVFLGVSVFIPRLWCRWFCGCGALLDFFHKTSNHQIQKENGK